MEKMTTEELQDRLAAVTIERDTLLQRHRNVCKCCAALDADPQATIQDFLETYSTKKPK